jgi:hypothetical protein
MQYLKIRSLFPVYDVLYRNRLQTFSSVIYSSDEGLLQFIFENKRVGRTKVLGKNITRGRSLILLGYSSNQD